MLPFGLPFVVSLLIFGNGREFTELFSIVIGGTLISVVGLIDDRYGLGPRGKLIGQATAALVLVFGGVQTQIFNNQWLDILLTIMWVIGIVNALNLMDNMDGLAAGVAAAASGSFLLLAIPQRSNSGCQSGSRLTGCLSGLSLLQLPACCDLYGRYRFNAFGVCLGRPWHQTHLSNATAGAVLDGANPRSGSPHFRYHTGFNLSPTVEADPGGREERIMYRIDLLAWD